MFVTASSGGTPTNCTVVGTEVDELRGKLCERESEVAELKCKIATLEDKLENFKLMESVKLHERELAVKLSMQKDIEEAKKKGFDDCMEGLKQLKAMNSP